MLVRPRLTDLVKQTFYVAALVKRQVITNLIGCFLTGNKQDNG